MSKRSVARAVIVLLIAVVLGCAYAVVVRNQTNNGEAEAPAGFLH